VAGFAGFALIDLQFF